MRRGISGRGIKLRVAAAGAMLSLVAGACAAVQLLSLPTALAATSPATAIDAGSIHSCVIRSGKAYCWGDNTYGELGDNSTISSSVPVAVYTGGALSGVTLTQITAGVGFTCALSAAGAAYCWGHNSNGELGNNATATATAPVAVSTTGVLAGVTLTQITAGNAFACGLSAAGAAYCWGHDTSGQLGNNASADSHVPVAVTTSGALSGVTLSQVTAGTSFACGLSATGAAYCWGSNGSGQLGNGTTSASLVPVAVTSSGALSGVTLTQITLGSVSNFTCALSSVGAAYCWGGGSNGTLGDNLTGDSHVPVAVTTSGALSGVTLTQLTAGGAATCALSGAGTAYCWGSDADGQLGNNSTAQSNVPVPVTASGVLSGVTLTQISAGASYVCAMNSAGAAYCWGLNSSGQLGNTATADNSSVPVVVGPPRAVTVGAGSSHSCDVRGGNAYCWGDDTYGQLGNGTTTTTPQSTPVAVSTSGVLSGVTLTQISAGTNFACALSAAGAAYCWGQDNDSQLGNNSTTNSSVPVAVSASGVLAGVVLTEISSSDQHTCALSVAGAAYCWGYDGDGELGNGSTATFAVPVAVSTSGALSGKVLAEVSVGQLHTCAVDTTGAAYCWGDNSAGELGDGLSGTTFNSDVPVAVTTTATPISGKYLIEITAGADFTCALDSTGLAYCWGSNTTYGELGDGNTTTNSSLPVAVTASGALSGVTLTQISAGAFNACALSAVGASYCWGNNADGEFGSNNFTTPSDVPVATYAGGVLSGKTLIQISAGSYHTCAQDAIGAVYCWGLDSSGQLGNNSTASSDVAVLVLSLVPGSPTAVAAFPADSTAVVYWVAPVSLGTGTLTGYTVTASPGTATCTTTGATSCTLAGLTDGTAYTVTVVTNTTAGGSYSSTTTVTPWPPTISIATGSQSSCTLYGGNAYCWGDDTYGELGNNIATSTSQLSPVAVYTGGALSGVTLTQIAVGANFACALSSAGAVYCWGLGTSGQLGNGTLASSAVPVAVTASAGTPLSGVTVTQITASSASVCALSSAGAAYCWGAGGSGQLGNGTTTAAQAVPVAVSGSLTLAGIDAGGSSACGLSTAGAVYCWGLGTSGQLGNSANTSSNAPVAVTATSGTPLYQVTMTQITVGGASACAASAAGVAYCWGYGIDGELGNSANTSSNAPVAVTATSGTKLSGVTVTQITAGSASICALSSAGAAYCWGLGTSGQLGNSSTTSSNVAVAVTATSGTKLSGVTVTQITAGTAFTCAAGSTGTDYCWGQDAQGELGNNSTGAVSAAVLVGPQAPTSVIVTPGNTTAAVSWTAPGFLNNGALTGYTAGAAPGTATCTTTGATGCTVTGLTTGTTYTITVTTTASTGTSAPSTPVSTEPTGLVMTTPGSLTWAITDSGSNQSTVDSVPADQQITVGDTTGSGAGWHISLSATTFTAGPTSLPNTGAVSFTGSIISSLASTAPSATCVGSCTLPTDTTTYPVAVSTAISAPPTYTIYDTSAGTGEGVMTIGGSSAANPIGWWVNVPASLYSGSYTSTVTLSIVSGP